MEKRIIRRQCEAGAGLTHYPLLLQRIYAARNIETDAQLERTFERLLPYQSLMDIDKATEILITGIKRNKRFLIVGDFDADGATSTALAVRALRLFGAKHIYYLVPNRFAYGYGLTPELVVEAEKMAPDIIITVDNGIANHPGVDAAKARGIQVVITDHHLPAPTLPNADAIVNPNQHCDPFPSKNLAGVGVIFYVMLALRKGLQAIDWFKQQNLAQPNMAKLLDLVALGTVADLVPLDQNNRILIHHGLKRIRAGQCAPGIVALLELSNRDFTQAQTADLGYAVGSRLNAAGRLDDMSVGIECLLTDDPYQARSMAKTLNDLNFERRQIEQAMQIQALNIIKHHAEKETDHLPKGLCLYDDTWHQGVIGILASRIKDRYHRPVIIFAPGQEDELKGSARSIHGLHIRDVLALMAAKHPQLIKKFGGHAMAAGLTIARNVLEDFKGIFDEVVSGLVSEEQLQHSLYSDGELEAEDLTLDVALMLRDAGPWGQAFPEPVFDNKFKIVEQRIVGDKHLKLRLMHESQKKLIDAMAFFIDTSLWPNHRCENVHVAYRLDINEFKGRKTLQLLIDYMRPL